jgi:hypothetical protein
MPRRAVARRSSVLAVRSRCSARLQSASASGNCIICTRAHKDRHVHLLNVGLMGRFGTLCSTAAHGGS